MKIRNLLLIPLILFASTAAFSQIVGDDAFLQSEHLEVGINKGGVYVSQGAAPEAYHNTDYVVYTPIIDSATIDTVTYTYPYDWYSYYDSCACWVIDSTTIESYTYVTWSYLIDSSTIDTITYTYSYDWYSYYDSCACWVIDSTTIESYTYVYWEYFYTYDTIETALGITFDSDMDGWDIGDPTEYWGDVTLPGSPEEGFGIEIDGNSYYNASQYLYPNDIPGSMTSWDDSGDTTRAVWEGDIAGVHVKQETLVPDGKLYFYTKVTLTNTGTSDLTDVFYLRNFDPDQEQPWSWDFVTDNIVHYNFPVDTQALVSAEGNTMGGNFAMYGSRDSRSRVSHGAFFTSDANPVSDAWYGITPFSSEGELEGDIALQISYKIDVLTAGSSETFTLAYIFSNDEAIIDEALAGTKVVVPAIEECVAATDINADEITETTASVEWVAGSPGIEYFVEWRAIGTPDWLGAITTDMNYLLSGLMPCTYYNFRVTTLCGDETPSPMGSFKTECVTSVEDATGISAQVYPNPSNGDFMISLTLPSVADATITIADALGRLIYENKVTGITTYSGNISLGDIASGIYTLKVVSGENTSSVNLVIE
ncbi:MAG: T9SS type A sorting domain-containing protein [Chitinophagales bacterium]